MHVDYINFDNSSDESTHKVSTWEGDQKHHSQYYSNRYHGQKVKHMSQTLALLNSSDCYTFRIVQLEKYNQDLQQHESTVVGFGFMIFPFKTVLPIEGISSF